MGLYRAIYLGFKVEGLQEITVGVPFGFPILRIIICWGLHWGPTFLHQQREVFTLAFLQQAQDLHGLMLSAARGLRSWILLNAAFKPRAY